jgi:cytoskeletal protein CcmA (bactofilin family)
MPTIVFLFVYLSQLLRIGEEEAAEELWDDLTESDSEHDPVLIPRSSKVSDDAWRVSTPATIGDDCRLNGNVRAESMTVGEDTEIYGSLRAKEDVSIGEDTIVHGDVTTRGGTVTIDRAAEVRGDVSCEALEIHEDAEVDGAIRARGEVSFVSEEPEDSDDEPEDSDDATTMEDDATTMEDDDEGAEPEAAEEPAEQAYEPAIVSIQEVNDSETFAGTAARDSDSGDFEPAVRKIAEVEDDVIPDAEAEPAAEDGSSSEAHDEESGKPAVTIPDAEGDVTNGDRDADGLAGVIAEAEER